jgi:hypothetical protein
MDRPPSSAASTATADVRRLGDAVAFDVRAEAGTWVTVHAGADPDSDARQLVAGVSTASPRVVVIIAAGLGYLTAAAADRWPDATIVVVEPDAAVAAAARRRCPTLYAAGRVRLVTGPEYAGGDDLWRVFDHAEGPIEAPPMIADPVLARAWPSRVRDAARLVGRAVAAARMNAEARAQHAGRYLINTLRNARHVALGPNPAALAGQFADVPAIVVGAGPSLTPALPALRALADRALVIAADTAWRPLVAAGVQPHLVVAVDPTPENGRHLQHVPAAPDTWIVAEASVDPPSLAPHAGRVAPFRVAAHQPWPWLVARGVDTLTLRAWGSVLTSAFDLALLTGGAPLVFVGADLAFTDGRPYCRGTSLEDEWARHAARGVSLRQIWANTLASRPLVPMPSLAGGSVSTAPHLVEFRDWIVARAAEATPGRVVNASGAGILYGPGVTQASLADVLASRPPCAEAVSARIRRLLGTTAAPTRADDLAAALGAIARRDADTEPLVAQWVAAGRPTLTADAIRSAADDLAAAFAAPPIPPAERPPAPTAMRWFVADRVAAMRARLTGESAGLDGVAPPAPRALADALSAARGAAAAVLALPEVAIAPGDDVAAGAAPETVPLSQRFRWTSEASVLVAALEEACLDVPPDHTAPASTSAGDDWRAAPVAPRANAEAAPAPIDAAARAAVAAMHLALEARVAPPEAGRDRRLVAAAARALGVPGLVVARGGGATLRLRSGVLRLPLVPEAFIRAATGTIVEAPAGREPADAFLGAIVCEIAPDVLTSEGVPRGWSVATLPDDTALFVPAGSTNSLAVGVDGPPTTASSWPGPITGETPWPAAAGRLAWNARTHDVYWHAGAGAPPAHARAPFTPAHVACLDDDRPIWTGTDGRLWQWRPGDGPGDAPRLVATLPGPGIPRRDGTALVVAPMPRDAGGRAERRRLDWEWRVDVATGEVEQQACGVEGQCARVASSGRWTAATHPYADLVRLTAPDGRTWWLACDTPLGAAWAGASLVVALASGELLRFPHLRTSLSGPAAGPALAL